MTFGVSPQERCIGMRRDGVRCGRKREQFSNYCVEHGGNHSLKITKPDLWGLPVFYRKFIKGTIAEFVDAALAESPDKQCALFAELAIMRATATDALTRFCEASDAWQAMSQLRRSGGATEAAALKVAELLAISTADVREAMQQVRVMAQACAAIETAAKDRFSIHNINFVVAEITKIVYQVFGDDEERARVFEGMVRERVKLVEQIAGTTKLPGGAAINLDETVDAMDASVPFTDEPLPESKPLENVEE